MILSYVTFTKSTGLSLGGTIILYAGKPGIQGYNKSATLATDTRLSEVSCVAISPLTGDLFIADTTNFVVRVVEKRTRIVTTVAGTNDEGYDGDGGLATSAKLGEVSGVSIDSTTGDIYIADSSNNVIRVVTISDDIINTIAGTGIESYSGDGGLATSATLKSPTGCVLDPSTSNLYIADMGNNVIRMITKKTGVITTIAGTGGIDPSYTGDGGLATAAGLGFPSCVAVAPGTGDIYIADAGNSVIRMITKSTGIITTVAGTGAEGYSGDGGLASSALLNAPVGVTIDNISGNIYISDSKSNVIRMIEKSTGIISTVAGNGMSGVSGDIGLAVNASLNNPTSVAIDTATNTIYIADEKNFIIRSVIGGSQTASRNPAAAPTPLVGIPLPPLNTPGAPTSSPLAVDGTSPPTEMLVTDSASPTNEVEVGVPTAAPTTEVVIDTTTPAPTDVGVSERPTTVPTNVGVSARPTTIPTNVGVTDRPTTIPTNMVASSKPNVAPTIVGVSGKPITAPTIVGGSVKPSASPSGPTQSPTVARSSAPRVPSTRNPASPVRPYTTIPPTADPTAART